MARKRFEEADRFLRFPLSGLCFSGPEAVLNKDLNAQMSVYVVSCILTDILKGMGIRPRIVAGYSSGFYAAAYAAEGFDFLYGLELVKMAGEILLREGRKMGGGMAVIFGLPSYKVDQICQEVGGAEIGIFNTPRQIIISGIMSSVKSVMRRSLNEGALDAYVLPASSAYHSKYMQPSAAQFLALIQERHLNDPVTPILSYSSLKSINKKEELKEIMATQLHRQVLWVDLIHGLRENGRRLFVEIGPGTVLTRTVKWIDRSIDILNTSTQKGLLGVIEKCNAFSSA